MSHPSVLIAGAGPTGLAAALFLTERGIRPRIVDRAPFPAPHSRALAVNPRTLELLEPTGVTARIIAEGRPAAGVCIHEDGELLASIDATDLHPRFGLVILSQERSEALLTEALHERGIEVERGVTAGFIEQDVNGVRMSLSGNRDEQVAFDAVYAADGARSDIRKDLGIAFPGSAYPETWPLFDLPMKTSLDVDRAHVMFCPDGLIVLIPVNREVWRVIASLPDPIARLPAGTTVGEPIWSSAFRIAHRVTERCAVGRIALGGDAAHIHSPVGARGMNLGIEDAAAFALCLARQPDDPAAAFARYHDERHHVHTSTVRRVRAFTSLARGANPALRRVRHAVFPVIARVPALRRIVLRTIAGLDHPPPV
jgi:2-polyprenyl-6-methoxyphenol hydroxylase-like FAD-dependent oxidoreductase